MKVRIYCRASTAEQHADRALASLQNFAADKDWQVQAEYVENASGASLARPELMRLLQDAAPGELLLVESIDRLSRLTQQQWGELKDRIKEKGLCIVAMDLPTSWQSLGDTASEMTSGILRAVNEMLIDILATMARVDYETRKARQAQGIERAKAEGKYTGRSKDDEAREVVRELMAKDIKPERIMKLAGVSRATFYRIKKELSAGSQQ